MPQMLSQGDEIFSSASSSLEVIFWGIVFELRSDKFENEVQERITPSFQVPVSVIHLKGKKL